MFISYFQLENLMIHSLSFEVCLLEDFENFPLAKEFLKNKTPKTLKEIRKIKDKSLPILFLCQKGLLSSQIQLEFEEKGFTNAFYFQGGMCVLEEELKQI